MLRPVSAAVVLALVSATGSAVQAGDVHTDGQLVSTATSGAPLAVSSQDLVANLNADLLDGADATSFADAAATGSAIADLQSQIDALSGSGGWVACGVLSDLTSDCGLTSHPPEEYEYGIKHRTGGPVLVQCTLWTVGRRIYNVHPFFTQADDPSSSMGYGGFLYTTGTNATNELCPGTGWRLRYWSLDASTQVTTNATTTCEDATIYCR